MTQNPLQTMISAAINKKPDEFTQAFEAAIQEKIQGHVNSYKTQIQGAMLGVGEQKEEEIDPNEEVTLVDTFEKFLEEQETTFESLEDAIVAFAEAVELDEETAIALFDHLTEEEENDKTPDTNSKETARS